MGVQVTGVPVTASEASPLVNQDVATFTTSVPGLGATEFNATIDWGDATPTTAAAIVADASGLFHVVGSHTYAAPGSFPVAVDVSGKGGVGATGSSSASVSGAPIFVLASPLVVTQGTSLSSATPVAAFTILNPSATVSRFTATVDWGDGTSSNGTIFTAASFPVTTPITGSGANFVVVAAHGAFANVGTLQTRVKVSELNGSSAVGAGTVQVTAGTITAGPANVADAPENTTAGGVLAQFSSTNPMAVASEFTASMDWGDGTPPTTGTVTLTISPGGTRTFNVIGTHVYADARSTTGTTFPVQVAIRDIAGAAANVTTPVRVTDVPINLAGFLNPSDDSGVSASDGITNVRAPRFFGTSEPNSTVVLFASPLGSTSPPSPIGVGVTDAAGVWNVTPLPLADGGYVITASATDASGITQASATIMPASHPLVIDTVGPTVTGVLLGRLSGQVLVAFHDERSGLDLSTLVDASNYLFTSKRLGGQSLPVNQVALFPGASPTDPVDALITLGKGAQLKGGTYTLTIRSGGIRDVAGNALDGEFYGTFPSGNGTPGGDFVATLRSIHRKVFPPVTTIGTSNPLSPVTVPGTTTAAAPTRHLTKPSAMKATPKTPVVHPKAPVSVSLRRPVR